MRIFGSESMNNILEKLGLKDGESIDHPWINKALERAQQKVEARNFDIRKTLLKFDNVLNDQRQVIFSQRNEVIENKDPKQYSENFLDEIIDDLKLKKTKKLANAGSNEINMQLKSLFGKSFEESEINELVNLENKAFEEKIKNKFKSSREERIKMLNEEQYNEIEKRIFLQLIDQNWKLHIQYLEQLRQVIGLRSYGQRDPLVEYKKEAFTLFENLLSKLKYDLITILFNLKLIEKNDDQNEVQNEKNINKNNNPKCLLVLNREGKISRNDRCEATGKKFKHCCGAL